ncbi:MAG: helix-turn-helix domain-containing protein [Thermodesulfobacteriota bacterium]|nr:helix-turn-helix domain-containing protein [Thermodesulfobacteriota bacterium]
MTVPELAKLLGVSRIAIYNQAKKGEIPATKIGRTYVITNQSIANIALLKARRASRHGSITT